MRRRNFISVIAATLFGGLVKAKPAESDGYEAGLAVGSVREAYRSLTTDMLTGGKLVSISIPVKLSHEPYIARELDLLIERDSHEGYENIVAYEFLLHEGHKVRISRCAHPTTEEYELRTEQWSTKTKRCTRCGHVNDPIAMIARKMGMF